MPYSPMTSPLQTGEYLGYYDKDNDKISVYTLKGYAPEEWLVDCLDVGGCNEYMIFREKNTTTIPEGFSSDYPWN